MGYLLPRAGLRESGHTHTYPHSIPHPRGWPLRPQVFELRRSLRAVAGRRTQEDDRQRAARSAVVGIKVLYVRYLIPRIWLRVHGCECTAPVEPYRSAGAENALRHFPTRQALLEAVFVDQIEALSAEAERLLDVPSPGAALATWLRSVLAHNVSQRGLKEALMADGGSERVLAQKTRLHEAGAALLTRAQQAGAIRPDLDIADLLRLVHGIALANEKIPESVTAANRCLLIMIDGLRQRESAARGLESDADTPGSAGTQ